MGAGETPAQTRAKPADLFLNRIKTVDRGSAPGRQGGKIGENLADDEAADAIIDGASDNLPRHQFFRRIRVHRRMTRANPPFFHFFSRISTDVYIQLVYLRDLIVIFVAKVNRGVSDHTKHRPFATQNLDPFTPGDCSITPTDTREIDESFVRDVLNHKADFVGVGFQHYRKRFLFSLQGYPGISIRVIIDRIAEPTQIV